MKKYYGTEKQLAERAERWENFKFNVKITYKCMILFTPVILMAILMFVEIILTLKIK